MAKNTPMSEEELKALTDSEMTNAIGYHGGKLAEQRRKAMYYYLGEPVEDLAPPEVDGRSSVVSPDVRNTIEAMLPQLMVKFTGGDTVVEFEPTKAGDEPKAKQVTDYLNYLFFKKNSGHNVTYTLFKDALLQKRGIAKVWWDDTAEETKEEYRALSSVELAEILEDKEIEPVAQKSYPDEDDIKQREEAKQQLGQQLQQAQQAAMQNPQAGQAVQQIAQQLAQIDAAPPVMLYDLEVKRTKTQGKVCVENVPPEEFLISRSARTIADARFVGHRFQRTLSDLKSQGYKNVDQLGSDGEHALNAEAVERRDFDDEESPLDEIESDESQRKVWVTECYLRCDFDGDGISELRKVVRAGNEILDNDVVDVIPFISVCPVPMPHRFFGLSIADLSFDSQKTKTSLLRSRIDNTSLETNGRYFAVDGQVNLDDLMTSRPGGIVRMKAAGMAGRLDQGSQNGAADGLLEYMEGFLESSTGWTRQSQGNSAGDLQGTATGMNIITNKDDMRLDLIARNFAEGFCEMFRMMLKLVCQYQQQPAEIHLSGEWLTIDPREWRNQFDVSINVGLGVGNKDQRIQHLMALRAQQDVGMQFGVANPMNVYEANKELVKELGFKNPDKFFTDPVKNPPPQRPDPEQMKAQAQLPLIQAKAQADAQLEQMKLQGTAQTTQVQTQAEMQLERERMAMQAQVDQNRQAVEQQQQSAKMEMEARLAEYTAQLDLEKEAAKLVHARELEAQRQAHERALTEMKIAAEERKANLAAQTTLQSAQMSHQTAMETGSLSARTEMEKMDKANAANKEARTPPKPDKSLVDEVARLKSEIEQIKVPKAAEPRKSVTVKRGKDGKAMAFDVGGEVIPIKRGKDGRIEGI